MAKTRKLSNREKHKNHISQKPHSWAAVISLFTCKYLQVHQVQQKVQHQHQRQKQKQEHSADSNTQRSKKEEAANKKKMKCSGSLCSNTKVMQKPELIVSSSSSSSSPEDNNNNKKRASNSLTSSSRSHDCNNHRVSNRSTKTNATLSTSNYNSCSSSSSSSNSFFATSTTTLAAASPSKSGSSLRSKHFRRFSGCYECKMVVDPVLAMTRDPSLRNSVRSCAECGEIFMKPENLELHQIVKHAVSELGPEDTSRNIVEIIFQSSWLKRQTPVCKIDRILKVQNTPRIISRFEEYRDTIKSKATKLPKKHPRCLADGNELLRFHCTTLMCSLGLNGSTKLCDSIPSCGVCSVIKNGFKLTSEISAKGILTTATSGKAHDSARLALGDGRRAMLVCRVIAGRVKKKSLEGNVDDYDSVGGSIYSNLDELYVFNPEAILPCFVVIYRGF